MAENLDLILKIAVLVFIAGTLFRLGLEIDFGSALRGLGDGIFILNAAFFGFVVGPLLAILVSRVVPLEEPYAIGLLILSLCPCAPNLPSTVVKAKGDASHGLAMLIVGVAGTMIALPVLVPLIVPGLSVEPAAIAGPVLLLVMAPLVLGMASRRVAPGLVSAFEPPVRIAVAIAALAFLVLVVIVFGEGFLLSVGKFATLALVLFLGGLTAISYRFGLGLAQDKRSVIALGLGSRNVGAALAPLVATTAIDQRAIVMVALSIPVMIVLGPVSAALFARRSGQISPPEGGAT